jgi:uncharacterized phage protein gp47/JayE
MEAEFQTLVPDVYLGPDGNLELLFQVFAGVIESVFTAASLVNDDMYVSSASLGALQRWGEQYGVFQKDGVQAAGTLLFTGAGGTFIPIGTQAAYDPETGEDVLYFSTIEDATIPNPGIPTAPTTAAGTTGALTGTYAYGVTFTTLEGETALGASSTPLVVASKRVELTGIPIGGPGTQTRKLYRSKDGGDFLYLAELLDNTDTDYSDNNSGALAGLPPFVSSAEKIEVAAQAELAGTRYNLVVGSVNSVADAAGGITAVTNPTAFVGGSDSEPIERFRRRLLDAVRNPNTCSASDIQAWAESIPGVEQATVSENYNLTTPAAGTTTVWISGPGGSIATPELVEQVDFYLQSLMRANIILIVSAYTPVDTDVEVDVVLDTGFTLPQVSPDVQQAISDYIYNLEVGETLRINGIIDAVYGMLGVLDLSVVTPGTDETSAVNEKRLPGTITVGT